MAKIGIYPVRQGTDDPDGPLAVTAGAPSGSLNQGSKDVAAAATPERLVAVATPAIWVAITARPSNTGSIVWGGSNAVRATDNAEIGAILAPGQSVAFAIADLRDIWLDAEVGTDGVSFTYMAE